MRIREWFESLADDAKKKLFGAKEETIFDRGQFRATISDPKDDDPENWWQ